MADKMKIIAITPPALFTGEARIVERLLEGGIDVVHLRLPEATAEQAEALMSDIDAKYHNRITLASHYELLDKFGFGGVHLRPDFVPRQLPPALRVSRSCHRGDDLKAKTADCDYAFISPVYDSISKRGYKSAFSLDDLASLLHDETLRKKLVALGGVTAERLQELKGIGFQAAAFSGYLFDNIDALDERILSINHYK